MPVNPDEAFDVNVALEQYAKETERLRQLLLRVFVDDSRQAAGPEQIVVFCLLISCKDICFETLHLVKAGFGRADVRGVRTMYECVVTARYLTIHPEQTLKFLGVFHQQWAKVMQNIPDAYRAASVSDELKQKVPKNRDSRHISTKDLDWSGTHTRQMAREAGALVHLHPFAFEEASGLVHPSPTYVITMLKLTATPGCFQIKVDDPSDAKFALR